MGENRKGKRQLNKNNELKNIKMNNKTRKRERSLRNIRKKESAKDFPFLKHHSMPLESFVGP